MKLQTARRNVRSKIAESIGVESNHITAGVSLQQNRSRLLMVIENSPRPARTRGPQHISALRPRIPIESGRVAYTSFGCRQFSLAMNVHIGPECWGLESNQ